MEIIKQKQKDAVTVCLSSNDKFFNYLVVCIHSIIKNSNSNNFYEIVILEKDISEGNKEILKRCEKANISIKFYNVANIFENLDITFNINYHFSLECYFRIFIPYIFKKYSKVLYIDCDAICLTDIANIYNQDLDGNMLGAVKDLIVINRICSGIDIDYYCDYLKLKNPYNYFNTGVLLMDIQKLLDFNFVEKSLNLIKEIVPKYVDQCIINKVVEGNVKFLNLVNNASSALDELQKYSFDKINLPEELYNEYQQSIREPVFYHYMSDLKPWKNLNIKNSNYFWQYARETEVYEKILIELMANVVSSDDDIIKLINSKYKIKFNYYRSKILYFLTLGKAHKHYKEKRNCLKEQVRKIREYSK